LPIDFGAIGTWTIADGRHRAMVKLGGIGVKLPEKMPRRNS
jgi:hypothetical protein